MNKSLFVSVVMPVYNCAEYLKDAIESILVQTFDDFEFIIINDGSTDESPAILNYYASKDARIKVIDQTNQGIVTALNKGLSVAKGEWIFRMDQDDISLPNRFKLQVQLIKKDPTLVLLGGWSQQIDAQGNLLKINKLPAKNNQLINAMEGLRPFFAHPTACFRRDVVLRIGGYRERFRVAEDGELWLRLAGSGSFGCCQEVILLLRKHTQSLSNTQSRQQLLSGITAHICHLRRKSGSSDLSIMDENIWQDFTQWVEKRLLDNSLSEYLQGRRRLSNIWNVEGQGRMDQVVSLIKSIPRDSSLRKSLWGNSVIKNFIHKLAQESKTIWK